MKLVGTQHGCHYGTARWFREEDHQVAIYDRFFSWGWDSRREPKIKPLAAAKLNKAKHLLRPRPDGRILLATYTFARYAYKMFSVPVSGSGALTFFDEQFRFARALPQAVRETLLVRLFPNDRDWSQGLLWDQACPGVETYLGTTVSMFEQMNQSRLFVTLANSTPALEGLVADFPSVLLTNPGTFEVSDDATPYFDGLREAGILHDTPEDAAAKVAEVFEDPLQWWNRAEVQKARREFCARFALTSDRWLLEWRKELVALVR